MNAISFGGVRQIDAGSCAYILFRNTTAMVATQLRAMYNIVLKDGVVLEVATAGEGKSASAAFSSIEAIS